MPLSAIPKYLRIETRRRIDSALEQASQELKETFLLISPWHGVVGRNDRRSCVGETDPAKLKWFARLHASALGDGKERRLCNNVR